jgi:hypothetical protein
MRVTQAVLARMAPAGSGGAGDRPGNLGPALRVTAGAIKGSGRATSRHAAHDPRLLPSLRAVKIPRQLGGPFRSLSI